MANQIDFKTEHSNSLHLFHRLARIHSHHLQQLLPTLNLYSPLTSKFTYSQALFEFDADNTLQLNHTSSPSLHPLPLVMTSQPLLLAANSFGTGILSQHPHLELMNGSNKNPLTDLNLLHSTLKNQPLHLPLQNLKLSSPNKSN